MDKLASQPPSDVPQEQSTSNHTDAQLSSLQALVKEQERKMQLLQQQWEDRNLKYQQEQRETTDIIARLTDENEQLDQQREQLQNKNNLINQQLRKQDNLHNDLLQKAQKQKDETSKQLQEAVRQVQTLTHELQEAHKKNASLLQHHENNSNHPPLTKEVSSLRAKLAAAHDKISRQERTMDRLHKQAETLRHERAQASADEIFRMEEQIQNMKMEHELQVLEKEQENQQLRDQVERLDRQRALQESQQLRERRTEDTHRLLKSMRQNLADSERRASHVREELTHQRTMTDQLRKKLASSEARYTMKLEQLEGQLKAAQTDQVEKEQKLREMELRFRDNSHHQEEIQRLQAEVARSEKETSRLNQLVTELQERMTRKLKDASNNLSKKESSWKMEKLELESTVRQSNENIQQLQNLVQSYEDEIETFRSDRDKHADEKRELVSELLDLRNKVTELEKTEAQDTSGFSDLDDDEEFSNMSRTMLKHRCINLKHDVEDAERRLSSSMADNAKRVQQIRRLEKDLEVISEENTRMVDVIASLENQFQSEADTLKQDLAQVQDQWSSSNEELRNQVKSLEERLSEAGQEKDEMRRQFENDSAEYLQQIENIKGHRDCLLSQVTELEAIQDRQKSEIDESTIVEERLRTQLEKAKADLSNALEDKMDLTARLADTTNQVCILEEKCEQLSLSLEDAEKSGTRLSARIEELQGEIEQAKSTAGSFVSSKVQSLERRCAELESKRNEAWDEIREYKEKVSSMERQLEETIKSSAHLKTKAKECEALMKASQQESVYHRQKLQECTEEMESLRDEVDAKSSDIDHMKTTIRVLNSNLARANADYKLLQKAALRAEFQQVAEGNAKEEIAKLKSELHTNAAKLKSMSEVFQSQRKVMALSNSLEDQLTYFIEEVISKADEAFTRLSVKAKDLQRLGSCDQLPTEIDSPDDLTDSSKEQHQLSQLKACIEELCAIVPEAVLEMEQKRAQLQAWKARRNIRLKETDEAMPLEAGDQVDANVTGNSSSENVQLVLQKMKQVFNRDILSPGKTKKCRESMINTDYLQSVIHSLESQIDGLLVDLKSANEALRAKDQVFADLEEVIQRHEVERDDLQKKVSQLTDAVKEMEDKLSKASSWKEAAEAELQELRGGFSPNEGVDSTVVDPKAIKKAALRMVAAIADRHDNQVVAKAFFHWNSQANAMMAISSHGQVAAELAEQLQLTREKFMVLKQRLKKPPPLSSKHRIASNNHNNNSRQTMNSIIEGYETT